MSALPGVPAAAAGTLRPEEASASALTPPESPVPAHDPLYFAADGPDACDPLSQVCICATLTRARKEGLASMTLADAKRAFVQHNGTSHPLRWRVRKEWLR